MWSDDWQSLGKHASGNQGTGYVVTRKGDNSTRYFLKELKEGGPLERRARFFREVQCYRTLEHPGIARFVASNVDAYRDPGVPLYVVTEFIDGVTLADFVQSARRVSTNHAFAISRGLLDILAYAHERDVVHRDIKPDNIVLRASSPLTPVLVDWGMSYLELSEESHSTETGQEIGNRFLRLPEHAAGSPEKRDTISDVTFVVGVLFYLLTKHFPRQLSDRNGHKPHERPESRQALAARSDFDQISLLPNFDRGFENAMSARWQSATELRTALDNTEKHRVGIPSHPSELLRRINTVLASHTERKTAEHYQLLEKLGQLIKRTAVPFKHESPNLACAIGGPTIRSADESVEVHFYLGPPGDESRRYTATIQGSIVGQDIIISVAAPHQETLLRFPEDELEARDHQVGECVRASLLVGVHDVLTGDGVNRRKYFHGRTFVDDEEARTAARAQHRPLFLVVFDGARPDKGNLDRLLGYFMQFESTKQTVDSAFVQAVVDLRKLVDRQFIPTTATFEECLLAIFTPEGNPVVVEPVYGNPNEGAKRVRAALAQINHP